MVGEQDRRVPLLVEPAQERQELVARHRVELGGRLVEHGERGATPQGGGQGDALQLAAGQLVGRAVEERGHAERERGLLDASSHRGRRLAAVLERKGDLGAHGPHHDLGLGVLQQRPDARGQLAGAVLASVHPGHLDASADLAAVNVRHQSAGGAQQRRLARARRPGQQHELSGLDLERDVAQGGRARARVAVREALEREHRGHRPIPRRSANGASAQATIAAATTTGPGPPAARSRG